MCSGCLVDAPLACWDLFDRDPVFTESLRIAHREMATDSKTKLGEDISFLE